MKKRELINNELLCPKCKKWLPITGFYKDRVKTYGVMNYCIKCWKSGHPERRTPEDFKLYKPKKENMWKNNLKFNYGVKPEQYHEMLVLQDGKCAICGTKKNNDENRKFCVDHDHETGIIRGLLCHSCNCGLGHFLDSPEMLVKAINYLLGCGKQ